MHVVDPGAHRAEELAPHKAEHVVLRIEAGRIEEHHLHEAAGRIGKLLQAQDLGQPGDGRKRALEKAVLGGRARLVGLVDKALAEVHAAQNVLVFNRHLVELHVGLGVLDVGLHQRRALLDVLDQHLLASHGALHQRGLLGGQRVRLLVFGLLFGVRANRAEGEDQEGEGDLPKRHVKLLVSGSSLPLPACTLFGHRAAEHSLLF